MVASKQETKEKVIAILDELPDAALAEVVSFVEYQRYKLSQPEPSQVQTTRFKPTPMGGLFKGANITDEDIAVARREMWGRYMDDEA